MHHILQLDAFHGKPIFIKANLERISDGTFELENKKIPRSPMMGTKINMGPSAVLKNDQLTLLLTSNKTPPMDLNNQCQSINPRDAN